MSEIAREAGERGGTARERSQSVDRAAELLVTLGRRGPMRLSELITGIGVPRRNIGRLLASLEAAGLVRRDPGTMEYDLGFTTAWLGNVAGERLDLARLAKPAIDSLMEGTGITALLHLRQSDALTVAVVSAPQDRLSVNFPTAVSIPLARGVGRLVLAYLPAEARQQYLRGAGDGGEDLQEIRDSGFLISHGEVIEGVDAVGAPVFDPSGDVIAVVAVASTTAVEAHVDQVVATAQHISALLAGPSRLSGSTTRA
ncbi:IclR family transcriptional regulator [Streptomyces sp. NPDC055105]|uniref:IclR family transcriptional regulator n=1 Tax=Streptomyces sp. NPDC055105 TaxID=3365719 RepID=UPI0037CCE901